MQTKLIAVTGATGAQGGGLARAILADPRGGFAVRAITRKASKARALADLGAEVVEADLDDEEIRRAFAGAHGGFFVTNFWEHFSLEREIAQARNMAWAAKEVGLFEGEFCGARDLAVSRSLNPRLQTFAQWLADNSSRIPLN